MRKLIHIPMLHSQEGLLRQADKVGQTIADASSERVSGVSQKFWMSD